MVPRDPAAGWTGDGIETSLLETSLNSQVRMVRPADFHGPFLPALYFAENLEGDTVSTNFFEIAATTVVKEP
jgi:hypothetical protein